MTAFVRVVSQIPNQNMLVGFPGISATLPRLEGKVEIRPTVGISAPVSISLVTIFLQRRETIHPSADSVAKKHLTAPRKEITDQVGKETLLFRCPTGKECENVYAMDLPFVIFIPFGRGGEETARRVPPASIQLPSRTAETYYEIVVTVQQGHIEQRKHLFPVPISRYDTLSTFGMYNRQDTLDSLTDHLVKLNITLPRWSYGPLGKLFFPNFTRRVCQRYTILYWPNYTVAEREFMLYRLCLANNNASYSEGSPSSVIGRNKTSGNSMRSSGDNRALYGELWLLQIGFVPAL